MGKIGSRLIDSAKEALAFAGGQLENSAQFKVAHIPVEIDVKEIRKSLNMTQRAFSSTFGFPLTTLRDWEQGRARPETSSRAYLIVIARKPEAVREALSAAA